VDGWDKPGHDESGGETAAVIASASAQPPSCLAHAAIQHVAAFRIIQTSRSTGSSAGARHRARIRATRWRTMTAASSVADAAHLRHNGTTGKSRMSGMHDLPVVQSAEEPSSIRSRNKLSTLNSFERPTLEICRAHWRRSHHPPLRPRKMVNDPSATSPTHPRYACRHHPRKRMTVEHDDRNRLGGETRILAFC